MGAMTPIPATVPAIPNLPRYLGWLILGWRYQDVPVIVGNRQQRGRDDDYRGHGEPQPVLRTRVTARSHASAWSRRHR
jgi:hypothetical protein